MVVQPVIFAIDNFWPVKAHAYGNKAFSQWQPCVIVRTLFNTHPLTTLLEKVTMIQLIHTYLPVDCHITL